MPYLYSDEQKQIREEVRRILGATDAPAKLRTLLELKGSFDTEFWKLASDLGWTGIMAGEANGGLGLGLIDALIVAEECGRALSCAPFLATGLAAVHILSSASGCSDLVRKISSGEILPSIAFAEGNESLPQQPAVRLTGQKLTGEKIAVLGGGAADIAVVLGADKDGKLCLATVDLHGSGVEREILETIDNSRCLATLRFSNAAATPLATEDALGLAHQSLLRLALYLSSESVGGVDACMTLARDYANERQAFGQPIGKFQAVKHAVADMWVQNEMARASILDAAVRIERGDKDAQAYVAAARLNAMHAYEFAAAAATQIHGAFGVTWDADLHLHYRRARSLAVEAGSPAFWEDQIVSILETS